MALETRLHVICGCGNSTLFAYETVRDWRHVDEDSTRDETIIDCINCGTLHFLSKLLHEKPKNLKPGEK